MLVAVAMSVVALTWLVRKSACERPISCKVKLTVYRVVATVGACGMLVVGDAVGMSVGLPGRGVGPGVGAIVGFEVPPEVIMADE